MSFKQYLNEIRKKSSPVQALMNQLKKLKINAEYSSNGEAIDLIDLDGMWVGTEDSMDDSMLALTDKYDTVKFTGNPAKMKARIVKLTKDANKGMLNVEVGQGRGDTYNLVAENKILIDKIPLSKGQQLAKIISDIIGKTWNTFDIDFKINKADLKKLISSLEKLV